MTDVTTYNTVDFYNPTSPLTAIVYPPLTNWILKLHLKYSLHLSFEFCSALSMQLYTRIDQLKVLKFACKTFPSNYVESSVRIQSEVVLGSYCCFCVCI